MLWIIVLTFAAIIGFYLNLRTADYLNKLSGFSQYFKGAVYGVVAGWAVAPATIAVLWRVDTPVSIIIVTVFIVFCVPWYLGFIERGQKWRSRDPV